MLDQKKRRLRLAVDVGGTFTDVTLQDPAARRLASAKVLTTPSNRAAGVMMGIRAVLDAYGARPSEVREIIHGSTTGTNALIERTGAKVGFLTTQGFRDILEIGRLQRPPEGIYDINVDRPSPLVPRALCLTVRERIDAQGAVLVPLDELTVRQAAATFRAEGVDAVAICFLFSFLNPTHEEAAARIIAAELPRVAISVSNRISPEYREYERASTAVINAYLSPVMSAYLDDLERRIESELGDSRLFVIQANGGSTSAATARERAVTTVNSGPAGGVVAGAFYGRLTGRDRLVSVDMGGTSFDIGLIEGGVPKVTTEGSFQYLPVKIPIIDLHIIGAGGGSIAWIDPGGALNVGPQSAGAEPGPACYGRRGTQATVTDANLVLGRLNPEYFNSGAMTLDLAAARRAVKRIAEQLGIGVEAAALGIIKVVNANMIKAIAAVTIQRGIDVREFSLLSFGGAGGAHAVDIARELRMVEAIVPPFPGTFSAVGLLVTDMRYDYVTALGGAGADDVDVGRMERDYRTMEERGRTELMKQGFDAAHVKLVRYADLKVKGQTYELSLALPRRGRMDKAGLKLLVKAFADLYRVRYAFFFEGEPIEIVNLRVSVFGRNPKVALPASRKRGSAVRKGVRPVYFESSGFVKTAIYERHDLAAGATVRGPAVIEEETSATVIPPGVSAKVADDLGLLIALGRRSGRRA